MIKQQTTTNKGFTILEVLVALIIFASAVTVLLVMTGKGIADVSVAGNRLTANYLAQEGIELMRYKRDWYRETGLGWGAFSGQINTGCGESNPCGLSYLYPNNDMYQCVGGDALTNPCRLYIGQQTGAYGSQNELSETSRATPFIREIRVEAPEGLADRALLVTSTVRWKQGLGSFESTMSEVLFDW